MSEEGHEPLTTQGSLSKDTIAFNIGWDAAIYDIQFFEDWPVELRIGWSAAKKDHPTPKKPNKYIRKWIQLRVGAYKRGKLFSDRVTPNYLEMINPGGCPASLKKFTYGKGIDTDWSVDRVNNDKGYERQNLVSMSTRINRAKSSLSYKEIEEVVIKQLGCIPGLSFEESVRLWAIVSMHTKRTADIDDEHHYYLGTVLIPDVPLNWIMNLQIAILVSLNNPERNSIVSSMRVMSVKSGNMIQMKKMLKRLSKFQASSNSILGRLVVVWHNSKNRKNYQQWLQGLRPVCRKELEVIANEFMERNRESIRKYYLESWAN